MANEIPHWGFGPTTPTPPPTPIAPAPLIPTQGNKQPSPFPFAPVSATGLFIDMMRGWYQANRGNLPKGMPSFRDVADQTQRTGITPFALNALGKEAARTDRADLRIDQFAAREQNAIRNRYSTGIVIPT